MEFGEEPLVEAPGTEARALINPDKVKQDYDDKILSIDYKYGIGPGDVFEWRGTNTYWIVYLQQITEDAYFRGEIRRCKYKIRFKDAEGKWCETWAAIRGPVETQIDSIQKNQIRVDMPNLSLNILMPRNEKTLQAFDRYKEFLFAGKCWQVKAPDSISMTNILEVNAEEWYIDRDRDDVENEMKDGLFVEKYDVNPEGIEGETFISPRLAEFYEVKTKGGTWSFEPSKAPVRIVPVDEDNLKVEVTWMSPVHGQFNLKWNKGSRDLVRTVVVEPLM